MTTGKQKKKTTHNRGEYPAAVHPSPKVTPGRWAPRAGVGEGGPASLARPSAKAARCPVSDTPRGTGCSVPRPWGGSPVPCAPARCLVPHPRGRYLRPGKGPWGTGPCPQGRSLHLCVLGMVPRARCPVPKEGSHYPAPRGRSPGHDARQPAGSPVHCALSPGMVPGVLWPRGRSPGHDARQPPVCPGS